MPETNRYTEAQLVALLHERSETALSYLYDNYSGALFGVINAIIPDKDIAGDVLQEVFVKIWKQSATYDATKGRLFTWMMNIARNASIDMLRSRNYKDAGQNRELTENVYEASGSTTINTDMIGLRKLVHSLKEEHKVLVELAYFEGYTQDEISKILNIPLGTVKTRLRAALLQLRELVKQ